MSNLKVKNITPLGGSSDKIGISGSLLVSTDITCSGNISASGTIFANNITSTGGDAAGIDFTDNLKLTGDLTASGNISASGELSVTGKTTLDTLVVSGSGIKITGSFVAGKLLGSGSFLQEVPFLASASVGNSGTFVVFDNAEFFLAGKESSVIQDQYATQFEVSNYLLGSVFDPGQPTIGLIVSSSGHVGIGTESPAHTLHVSGNAPSASLGDDDNWSALYVDGNITLGTRCDEHVTIGNTITASCDIVLTGSNSSIIGHGTDNAVVYEISASGNAIFAGEISGSTLNITNNVTLGNACSDQITVGGTISSSCDIVLTGSADHNASIMAFVLDPNTPTFAISSSGDAIFTGNVSSSTLDVTSNTTLGAACDDTITLNGLVTASCNVVVSGSAKLVAYGESVGGTEHAFVSSSGDALLMMSASFGWSGSFDVAESVMAIKFEDLPTTIDQAALIGTGSLYVSGNRENSANALQSKPLYIFTG